MNRIMLVVVAVILGCVVNIPQLKLKDPRMKVGAFAVGLYVAFWLLNSQGLVEGFSVSDCKNAIKANSTAGCANQFITPKYATGLKQLSDLFGFFTLESTEKEACSQRISAAMQCSGNCNQVKIKNAISTSIGGDTWPPQSVYNSKQIRGGGCNTGCMPQPADPAMPGVSEVRSFYGLPDKEYFQFKDGQKGWKKTMSGSGLKYFVENPDGCASKM